MRLDRLQAGPLGVGRAWVRPARVSLSELAQHSKWVVGLALRGDPKPSLVDPIAPPPHGSSHRRWGGRWEGVRRGSSPLSHLAGNLPPSPNRRIILFLARSSQTMGVQRHTCVCRPLMDGDHPRSMLDRNFRRSLLLELQRQLARRSRPIPFSATFPLQMENRATVRTERSKVLVGVPLPIRSGWPFYPNSEDQRSTQVDPDAHPREAELLPLGGAAVHRNKFPDVFDQPLQRRLPPKLRRKAREADPEESSRDCLFCREKTSPPFLHGEDLSVNRPRPVNNLRPLAGARQIENVIPPGQAEGLDLADDPGTLELTDYGFWCTHLSKHWAMMIVSSHLAASSHCSSSGTRITLGNSRSSATTSSDVGSRYTHTGRPLRAFLQLVSPLGPAIHLTERRTGGPETHTSQDNTNRQKDRRRSGTEGSNA